MVTPRGSWCDGATQATRAPALSSSPHRTSSPSASTGTDAQPYFRIFSPVAQGERFDADGAYVRRYLPELRDVPAKRVHRPWEAPALCPRYPAPIVDHAERRLLAIRRFEEARGA